MEAMQRMLKENGPPPEGRFADLKYLSPCGTTSAPCSTLLTLTPWSMPSGKSRRSRRSLLPDAGLNFSGPWPRTPGRLAGTGLVALTSLPCQASRQSLPPFSSVPNMPMRPLVSWAVARILAGIAAGPSAALGEPTESTKPQTLAGIPGG